MQVFLFPCSSCPCENFQCIISASSYTSIATQKHFQKKTTTKEEIDMSNTKSSNQTAVPEAKGAGASTLARNKNYYKPQKCGLFYVKFYLFLCCTELYFIFICDIMRYETQL